MAGDINRIIIIGRLVRDPELKYIQSGAAVVNFAIANNKIYNTKNGDRKEEVSYFDCIAWNKLGEVIAEYMQKGSKIAVEGRLQQRRWETDSGDKRSKIEIVADNIQFLDSKKNQTNNQAKDDNPPEGLLDDAEDVPGSMFADDDIPF